MKPSAFVMDERRGAFPATTPGDGDDNKIDGVIVRRDDVETFPPVHEGNDVALDAIAHCLQDEG